MKLTEPSELYEVLGEATYQFNKKWIKENPGDKMKQNNPVPLYGVEIKTNGKGHYYSTSRQPDEWYPGVTTVLGMIAKPALIPWAAKEASNKIKAYLKKHAVNRSLTGDEIDKLVEEGRTAHVDRVTKAADLGTRAHKAIDDIIEGRKPVITDDIKPPVEAFKNFVKENKLEIIKGDTKIASIQNRFGGSLDALGWKDGRFIIVDFKTSNGCYKEYAFQVAAYSKAFSETYGLDYLPEALILRVGKEKAEFEYKNVRKIGECFSQFLAAKTLWEGSKNEFYE